MQHNFRIIKLTHSLHLLSKRSSSITIHHGSRSYDFCSFYVLFLEKNLCFSLYLLYTATPSSSISQGFGGAYKQKLTLNRSRNGFIDLPEALNLMKIQVLGIVIGIGGCIILMVGFVFRCFSWRKKRAGEEKNPMDYEFIDVELEMDQIPRKFVYSELDRATRNFADTERVGGRGFDGVYRGFIEELRSYVAVKRISIESSQGLKEYEDEVKIISRLRNRNIVQLIGWCRYQGQLLLVYKFIPNGSLDSHLQNGKSSLTWEVRYRIAQGLASALFHLHEESVRCVLHCNIKSSNVMLDSNFNAKLGDFGLARFVDHEKEMQTTSLRGSMSYMAPEYIITGKASKRTDLYSFGIICLEIACGRKLIDVKSVLDWVWQLYGEKKVTIAADPKLCGDYDQKQMECLMIVGLWCAHSDYKIRPSIQQVLQVLNFEIPLPIF